MVKKRNSLWFWILGVLFVVASYLIVTAAVAGSEAACNDGGGEIVFSTDTFPPRFDCVTGLRI